MPSWLSGGAHFAYDRRVTTQGVLTPEQQLKVLALIWGDGEDGWVFLPWIPGDAKNKEERRAGWHEGRAFHWPSDQSAILDHLKLHGSDDLYFTPNTFTGESRVAQLTGEETCLYADLDEVDPRLEIDPEIKPTIAWQSSPGRFQAVWLLRSAYIGASEMGGLNHRLTAMIGADPSGWDTTQLLRVPGRPNFKFGYKDEKDNPAPGELLWVTNKKYRPQYFERILPDLELYGLGMEVDDHEIDAVDRHEVWGRVRLKVSHTVRQYMSLKTRQITEDHDRSEILWQIERDLADAGCSVAEIVSIIRVSPWNKYVGRSNEVSQLKSEAMKAKAVSMQDAEEDTIEGESSSIRSKTPLWLTERFEMPILRPSWLIRNIWSKGSCGFIAAEPKSYKSFVGLDMALSVATGSPFLNDPQFSTVEAPVLYIQEEDPDSLVMLRVQQILDAKSPDRFPHGQMTLDRVTSSNAQPGAQIVCWTPPIAPVPFAFEVRNGFTVSNPADQAWLLDFIEQYGFKLVVIDTLGTTLGGLTVTDDGLYPKVLNPLKDISNATGTAITILHHNRKSDDNGRRGQQMSGSGAFHAWTESALYLQKAEFITGQPAQVNIERESKVAGDLKFRMYVPYMFEERGDEQQGARQLWEPEVRLGWADIVENEEKPPTYTQAQQLILSIIPQNGKITLTEIVATTHKPLGTVRQLLNALVKKEAIIGSHDIGWRLR